MKRVSLIIILFALLIAACSGADDSPAASQGNAALQVTGGDTQAQFTLEDLQSMETAQASFLDVAYKGVPLATVLQEAGFDPQAMKAVKVIAADGFSANYDPELANKADTLLAFARAESSLAEDEGPLRMVLPDQEGKLNVRQVVEIQVIQ
jgi:DMSO/TMAO reductase YedYZ molybdopterin-dependent catalytic subunit